MWRCSQCKELIADSFDACWNCGTGRTGAVPSAFAPEPDDSSVPDPGPSPEDLHIAGTEEYLAEELVRGEDSSNDRRIGCHSVRFQFGLRKLFLLNFLAACILSGIQILTKHKAASEVLSPCIWPVGALSVIIMAIIGDALGHDWGVFVGSFVGVGIWGAMLGALALHCAGSEVPLCLPAHLVAMVVTVAVLIVPVLLRLRCRDASDDELPMVTRLLLGQRHRRNRKL